MEFLKLSAIILITVILSAGMPTFNREISALITFSCCIVVLLYIINLISPMVDYVKNIAEYISFEGILRFFDCCSSAVFCA